MLRNSRALPRFLPAVLAAAVLAGLVLARAYRSPPSRLLLNITPSRLPADGRSSATLTIQTADGSPISFPIAEVKLEVVEGNRRVRLGDLLAKKGSFQAPVLAGVTPGRAVFAVSAPGQPPEKTALETYLDAGDRAGDGTPDFSRLDEEADRPAFRRWFTFLAEMQFYRQPDRLPVEINDCGALLRYAYREALREHTSAWAEEIRLAGPPPGVSVQKYRYPFTPLAAALFRVRGGVFEPEDLRDGTFAQFADADTLRRRNTHPVGRSLERAEPGDLLFYRQLEQDLPFHAMIYLGRSQFESNSQNRIVYHTGPIRHTGPTRHNGPTQNSNGEIRRPTVTELLHHPSPRWRPLPGNPNFLGVHRWNILRR